MDISQVVLTGEVTQDIQKLKSNKGIEFGKLILKVLDREGSPTKCTYYKVLVSNFKLKEVENITKDSKVMVAGKLRVDINKEDNNQNLVVSLDTIHLIKQGVTLNQEENLITEDDIAF